MRLVSAINFNLGRSIIKTTQLIILKKNQKTLTPPPITLAAELPQPSVSLKRRFFFVLTNLGYPYVRTTQIKVGQKTLTTLGLDKLFPN